MRKTKRHTPTLRVAIIGGGKVGSTLGRLLVRSGATVRCVISRTHDSARTAARFIGAKISGTDLSLIPADTNLLFIATPHGAVQETALALARADHLKFSRLAVCHASGMLTADVLTPLAVRGATVFSFHPLQTFPRSFPPAKILESIKGIYYGVDGDARGIRMARRLARALKGWIVVVPREHREYYHAACVVASNHLTALIGILEEMSLTIGIPRDQFFGVFLPIISATLKNISQTSPADALSGPVARGGLDTIDRHLRSIASFSSELLPYFGAMTNETARLATRKGSITHEQRQAFAALVHLLCSQESESR